MATLAPKPAFPSQRLSNETDRRYLLSDSIAPSESASMIDFGDGDRTPRARSPVRAETSDLIRSATEQLEQQSCKSRPYRGFPSEEAYLEALREWAETKTYLEPGTTVFGYYGHKTMEEYAKEPRLELGLRKKWRARKERKLESAAKSVPAHERRNTVA